jgi:cytochrome b involved in lipid metabolism
MSSEGEKEKKESGRELPKYSWEEVAQHNSAESLWIVVQDKIYDVTKFMEEVGLKINTMNQGPI